MLRKPLNKTLLQIFLSLLLIALIIFISNYVILMNSMSGIYRQISDNNRFVAQNIVHTFDECFKEVNNLIFSIDMLPYQVYDSNGYHNLNAYNTFMFANKAKLLISQDYIFDYVLYFDDSETVITSKGTDNFNRVFKNKFNNANYAPEFWRNAAVTRHVLKFIAASNYKEYTDMGMMYTRKLIGIIGNNMIGSSGMNIIIFVDADKLMKYVNQRNIINGSSLIILDQDKNAIINTDKGEDDLDTLGTLYSDAGRETLVRKGRFEYYSFKSDYNDFTYISKIPYTYEGALSVARVNKVILAVAILFGVILSLMMSKYLYKPVNMVLKLVGGTGSNNYKETYRRIYGSIEQMQKENQLFRSQMSNIENEVKRSIFLKIIDDISFGSNLRDQINTCFKDIFNSDRFILASFNLKQNDNAAREDTETAVYFLPFAIEGMIREELNKCFERFDIFYIQGMQFVALIGLKHEVERNHILNFMEKAVRNLNKSLRSSWILTAAVSGFYTEIQDCKKAFRDIRICLFCNGINNGKLLLDAEKTDCDGRLYFPPDSVEKLSNYIISGNVNDTVDLINQIIDKNIESNTSYLKFESIVSIIFGIMTNTAVSYGYDREDITRMESEFFVLFDTTVNFEEMRKLLNQTAEELIENIKARKQSKLSKDFLLQYINIHYVEDLYLENMAEMAGTSPKYFSYFFKKTFDINFVEYINTVRISHAKKLLKNSDMLVSSIGEKVGYSNFSTFTSTFKKHCGVSPTEYRTIHKIS